MWDLKCTQVLDASVVYCSSALHQLKKLTEKLQCSCLTQLNQPKEAQLDPQDSHYTLQGDSPSLLTHKHTHTPTHTMHMPQYIE